MEYSFTLEGRTLFEGTVEADSEEEAIQKIKDGCYDDIEDVDNEYDYSTISVEPSDEDEEDTF